MNKLKLLNERDIKIYNKLNTIFDGQDIEIVFRVLTIYMVTSLERMFKGDLKHTINTIDLYCKGMKDVASSNNSVN